MSLRPVNTFAFACMVLLLTALPAIAQSPAPPSIAIAFGAAAILPNTSTSLTFTITSPDVLFGVGFTDLLPAGLVVSAPNGLTGSCDGGAISATPGANVITLSGAAMHANGSCHVDREGAP